jgi:hypothetical protein
MDLFSLWSFIQLAPVKSSLQERGKSAHIDPMLLDFGEEMLRK